MTPQQMREVARELRSTQPTPSGGQDPAGYIASLAIHSLADAIDRVSRRLPRDREPFGRKVV